MTGPGDEVPAAELAANGADRGHLRASHADREQSVRVLKAAFVQGRLAKDEFDLRVAQAFAARTYAELGAVTADFPAGLTAAPPLPRPAQGSTGMESVKAWARTAVVFTGVCAGIAVAAGGGTAERLVGAIIFVMITATLLAVLVALHAWLEQRAAGQPPPGGGGGGTASRRPMSADLTGQQPPQLSPRPRHAADATPVRRPRPALAG